MGATPTEMSRNETQLRIRGSISRPTDEAPAVSWVASFWGSPAICTVFTVHCVYCVHCLLFSVHCLHVRCNETQERAFTADDRRQFRGWVGNFGGFSDVDE